MFWTIKEGKYAEKLVEAVSMCDVREGVSSEVTGGSSASSTDAIVMGSTETRSGAGVSGWEQGWPAPMKLVTETAIASNWEDGSGRVVGSPRLMLDEDEDGDSHGVS